MIGILLNLQIHWAVIAILKRVFFFSIVEHRDLSLHLYRPYFFQRCLAVFIVKVLYFFVKLIPRYFISFAPTPRDSFINLPGWGGRSVFIDTRGPSVTETAHEVWYHRALGASSLAKKRKHMETTSLVLHASA